jgi:DNA-directed RNA polymerase specialized sigma24 family protein
VTIVGTTPCCSARARVIVQHSMRWASGRLPRWARDILDTSDLIQETVLETFKRLDAFEPRGDTALQAYLRQTQVNRLRNQLRRVASPTATTRPAIGSIPTSATR